MYRRLEFCCKERNGLIARRGSGVKRVVALFLFFFKLGELMACLYANGSASVGGGKCKVGE